MSSAFVTNRNLQEIVMVPLITEARCMHAIYIVLSSLDASAYELPPLYRLISTGPALCIEAD